MANKPTEQELRQQNLAEAVSKSELFFQKYGKIVYGCVAAVLLIALAILAYNRFILQPQKEKAQAEMFKAEQKFAQGSIRGRSDQEHSQGRSRRRSRSERSRGSEANPYRPRHAGEGG